MNVTIDEKTKQVIEETLAKEKRAELVVTKDGDLKLYRIKRTEIKPNSMT